MKWRTEVKIEEKKGFVKYDHKILSLGSCFADEIGERMKNAGFDIIVNPFGVIFNPVSILQLVQNSLDDNSREDFIVERNELWYHYGYHSKIYGESTKNLLNKVESLNERTRKRLMSADHLFLTLGTAWVWRLVEDDRVVANCHKMPAATFSKDRIGLKRLDEFSAPLFEKLFQLNPKLNITLTVSPVRHVKDGIHENNLSKSVLHLYCDYLMNKFENISYFPAFELVVDELRDYRFYKGDLIHPSEQAIDFVMDKFKSAYFDNNTLARYGLAEQLKKAEAHKPMNPSKEDAAKHNEHINSLKSKLDKIT